MNDPVRDLIELGRRQPHGESARRDLASFQAFEQRWERRGRGRKLVTALALSLALAAIGFWQWPLAGNELPLRYEVAREGKDSAAGEPALWQLKFSDGSRVALGSESSAHVGGTTARGARVILKRGSANVTVVPKQGGEWWFEAGPYRVHVLGTVFDLAWQPERQLFQLSLRHGSVEVTGPLVGNGLRLRAGQRLTAAPGEERLLIENVQGHDEPPAEPMAQAPSAPAAASEPGSERVPVSAAGVKSKRRNEPADLDFGGRVARGEFEEVVRGAQRAGIARVLERASASELTALADAARYLREDTLARRTLNRLRARFPGSPDGKAAAFFLGRLGRGRDALLWYKRYLAAEPDGPYAKQALGRLMTLHVELGETNLAEPLARAYLSSDPSGPYATSARSILTPGVPARGE